MLNCFKGHSNINMHYRMPAIANDFTMVSPLKMLALSVCGDNTAFLYYHSRSRILITSKSLSLNMFSNVFSWAMAVRKSDLDKVIPSI